MPKYTTEQLNAYHEAAHAVVSIIEGSTFLAIYLFREGSTNPLAQEQLTPFGIGKRLGCITVDETEIVYRRDALSEARIAMAGIVANKLMEPSKSYYALYRKYSLTDMHDAGQWITYHVTGIPDIDCRSLSRDEQSAVAKLERSQQLYVCSLLKEYWNAVTGIGDKLIERCELSYSDVLDLGLM